MSGSQRDRRRRRETGPAAARRKAAAASAAATSARPSTADEPAADAPEPADLRARVGALLAQALPDGPDGARALEDLAVDWEPDWHRTVEALLLERLFDAVSSVWRRGWQPADVVRITDRWLRAPHDRLGRAVLAAELARYAPTTIDPRWHAQLDEADVRVWWANDETAVQACGRRHVGGWVDFVEVAVELLRHLLTLPTLEMLGPVPGTARPSSAAPLPEVDDRVLTRVRALLAKAESTTFPAEAETFTAGAQALMARYSIDHALLAAMATGPIDGPRGRRLGIDHPYDGPRASLLDAVATANRCRAVWTQNLGFSTVIGYPTDVDLVEMLFTSLLVQATAALTREGSAADRAGRSRTRSFRESFLLAYAHRIRERLTETTRVQTEAAVAETGADDLLPVLASRAVAVTEAVTAMFPSLTRTTTSSARDVEGWSIGRAAADRATLTGPTAVDD